jgi:superfamily I DNA/RNA helicase
MIYVGDKYQQIYEWRGAVNAMEEISTDSTTFLTMSFRFGETIAEGASNILSLLGEQRPIIGNPKIRSRNGSVTPETILARTNASTRCDVVISTAHKAKGREWATVRLMDDFMKSQPERKKVQGKHGATNGHDPAELRLFYVAFTRARDAIEVAPSVLSLIGKAGGPSLSATGSVDVTSIRRQNPPPATTTPREPIGNGARAQASRSSAPGLASTVWKSPQDWRQPKQVEPPPDNRIPGKRKGLLGWLLNK